MIIQKWFIKELKSVDLDYKAIADDKIGIYDILKDGKTVDCFTVLNDAALTELRYRKWIGKQIYTGYETKRERAIKNQIWMKKERKRVAAKKHQLSIDMITKSFMRIWRHETTTTFT